MAQPEKSAGSRVGPIIGGIAVVVFVMICAVAVQSIPDSAEPGANGTTD